MPETKIGILITIVGLDKLYYALDVYDIPTDTFNRVSEHPNKDVIRGFAQNVSNLFGIAIDDKIL